MSQEARQWGMFLHFSQFAGYVIPIAGILFPIIIWQLKKDQLQGIDAHGKTVINWMISAYCYAIVSVILCIFLIGFVLLAALGIACLVFPIIAGIKANEGKLWHYPTSLRLLPFAWPGPPGAED